MAKVISRLRGTAAVLNTQTLQTGVIAADITNNNLRLFDGATLGGHEIINKTQASASLTGQPAILRDWDKAGLMYHEGPDGTFRQVVLEEGAGLELVEATFSGQPVLVLRVDSTVPDTATQVIAGDGLTGGGTLAANRTLEVDATVVRDPSTVVRDSRQVATGDGLTGGGDLTANRSFAVDATVVRTPETVVRNNTSVTGENGLIGGGTLEASRVLTPDYQTTLDVTIPANDTKLIGNRALFNILRNFKATEKRLLNEAGSEITAIPSGQKFVFLNLLTNKVTERIDQTNQDDVFFALADRQIRITFQNIRLSASGNLGIFFMSSRSNTLPVSVPSGITYNTRSAVFTNAVSPVLANYTDRIGIPSGSGAAVGTSGEITLTPAKNFGYDTLSSRPTLLSWIIAGTCHMGSVQTAILSGVVNTTNDGSTPYVLAFGTNTGVANLLDGAGNIQACHI